MARLPAIFESGPWQMSLGERAAIEGVLAQIRPSLSIEIGTAEGGSLDRIAAYSDEVHTIDIVSTDTPQPDHVHVHVGDSKKVLPRLLELFAADRRNVDFVLVDGDHRAEGVRSDVVNLLRSPAVGKTVIVLHDTMHESVRTGVEDAQLEAYPKISYVELDFLPGYMARSGPFANELWGGLGLVLVDAKKERSPSDTTRDEVRFDQYEMINRMGGSFSGAPGVTSAEAEAYGVRRIQALSDELHEMRGLLDEVLRSGSWRMTAPLRRLKRAAGFGDSGRSEADARR
jgi:Methyltransferase domain